MDQETTATLPRSWSLGGQCESKSVVQMAPPILLKPGVSSCASDWGCNLVPTCSELRIAMMFQTVSYAFKQGIVEGIPLGSQLLAMLQLSPHTFQVQGSFGSKQWCLHVCSFWNLEVDPNKGVLSQALEPEMQWHPSVPHVRLGRNKMRSQFPHWALRCWPGNPKR